MNLRGSYRALYHNSKTAILAAIEIYNKPQISYRDECFSILLINAWELLLKAILSKQGQRIFYPKKRKELYRTLSIDDALVKAKPYFPYDLPYHPIAENIIALTTYRDNAIHFYNQKGFSVLIYGLAQTSIHNYRDLVLSIFGIDIVNEITLTLLPLAFGTRPDPIEFLQNAKANPPQNKAVAQYINQISQAAQRLDTQHQDTSRFLTVFSVHFQSVKKLGATDSTDMTVGIASDSDNPEQKVVHRRIDPNISHPLRRKNVLETIGDTLKGVNFTSHTFQAIIWKYNIKAKPNYYWKPVVGGTPQYAHDIIAFLNNLSRNELEEALNDYRNEIQKKNRLRKSKK